jgi:hypothetical protein
LHCRQPAATRGRISAEDINYLFEAQLATKPFYAQMAISFEALLKKITLEIIKP